MYCFRGYEVRLRFFCLLLSLYATSTFAENQEVWLLVETTHRVLKVMEGDELKEVFKHIAIGRRGAGLEKARNDNKTPLGEYRIGWINENSKFRRFFGLSYPNIENAKIALQTGLIGESTYQGILRANMEEDVPPQNTALGGQIGIHGLGSANPLVHEQFDWTHGCIAMTNQQIDKLSQWVKKGTLVVIR